MKLSEVCIERPVLAWVMTFILVLVGLVGGSRLSLQQYPKIERPYITIETSLMGAGPEVIEAQITKVIEEAVSGLEGVESMTSTSSTEDSKVVLEFRPERGMDNATNDIRDRLGKFRDKLPDEATEPTITKSKAEEKPIITIALTSDTKEASELADYAMREIQKDLESISGVARVDVLGAGQYVMHIYLDPVRLAAYGITVSDVMTSLKRQNIEKPAGKLISHDREYLVTTVANLETPEEFDNLTISTKEKHLVRLRDVGYSKISADDRRTKTRYNGKSGVSIGVVKQSTSNPIEVARDVKKMVVEIEKKLPPEILIHIGSDKTTFIERSIKGVYKTIFEATALVILVVFAFLRSARASLIPLVTIPVSLIGSMFFMYMMNFSINILTLLAMVLAIGLVVDDAIVILENIYRYIEKGLSPFKAAVQGVKDISFAVIAMTLTLAAVYAPISLAQGLTGKLFTEFSLTLACAVMISGFSALTLSPMMCARMLRAPEEKKKTPNKSTSFSLDTLKEYFRTDIWLAKLEVFYDLYLRQILLHRGRVIMAGFGIWIIGLVIYSYLPQEFTPREDQSSISIEGQAPQSATLEYTDRYVAKLDAILGSIPEVDRRVSQINNPTFDTLIQLKEDKGRTTEEIVNELKPKLDEITGIEARIESASAGISGEKSRSVEFVIQGNKTYREIKEIAQRMSLFMHSSGIVDGMHSEIRGDTEDFTITIIRDKVSSLNIEPATISETVDALIRGRKATMFKRDNKLYEVRVEVAEGSRMTPHDITNLFVKSGDKEGTLVPLSELVSVNSRSGPIEIHHHNRLRSITLSARLKQGVSLGEGVTKVNEVFEDVRSEDVRLTFTGETKRFLTEGHTMQLIFILAICFIYLVMAAQFESWRDPFIILLSVPLSLAGAVMTLALIKGGSINLYTKIGFVTLIGLITKHGILMVDCANKFRDEGKGEFESIVEASRQRLRPILMTTFAMVLGALPLAFSTGAGSESSRQLGWVIVGGMSIGTLFTLFVVPAFYVFLSKDNMKRLLKEIPKIIVAYVRTKWNIKKPKKKIKKSA